MTRSDSYKVGDVLSAVRDAATANNIQSETFYKKDKGDETADYSYNYKLGTMTVKNVSVFYYGNDRANVSGTDVAMNFS